MNKKMNKIKMIDHFLRRLQVMLMTQHRIRVQQT